MDITAGIVGLGYVGGAIKYAVPLAETYDINPTIETTCNSLAQLVERVGVVYICVPTPMTPSGQCDTSIVESVVDEIARLTDHKIIIIKSTVPPGTTKKLQEKYPSHDILFSPEFLTEANYKDDYLNQKVMLVGYIGEKRSLIASSALIFQLHHIEETQYATIIDATVAEFYKYVANTFLATKVSFANEMASLAKKLDVDWNKISEIVRYDNRLGRTHWHVPGPDGHLGFGGTCFPKDLSAIRTVAKLLEVDTPILDAVERRNVSIDRPEKDWQELKGRAVSE